MAGKRSTAKICLKRRPNVWGVSGGTVFPYILAKSPTKKIHKVVLRIFFLDFGRKLPPRFSSPGGCHRGWFWAGGCHRVEVATAFSRRRKLPSRFRRLPPRRQLPPWTVQRRGWELPGRFPGAPGVGGDSPGHRRARLAPLYRLMSRRQTLLPVWERCRRLPPPEAATADLPPPPSAAGSCPRVGGCHRVGSCHRGLADDVPPRSTSIWGPFGLGETSFDSSRRAASI